MRTERQAFQDVLPFCNRPDVINFLPTTPTTARAEARPLVLEASFLQALVGSWDGDASVRAYNPPFTVMPRIAACAVLTLLGLPSPCTQQSHV